MLTTAGAVFLTSGARLSSLGPASTRGASVCPAPIGSIRAATPPISAAITSRINRGATGILLAGARVSIMAAQFAPGAPVPLRVLRSNLRPRMVSDPIGNRFHARIDTEIDRQASGLRERGRVELQ